MFSCSSHTSNNSKCYIWFLPLFLVSWLAHSNLWVEEQIMRQLTRAYAIAISPNGLVVVCLFVSKLNLGIGVKRGTLALFVEWEVWNRLFLWL
jgi:hypothetical protein